MTTATTHAIPETRLPATNTPRQNIGVREPRRRASDTRPPPASVQRIELEGAARPSREFALLPGNVRLLSGLIGLVASAMVICATAALFLM
jgi:hypothetical protein